MASSKDLDQIVKKCLIRVKRDNSISCSKGKVENRVKDGGCALKALFLYIYNKLQT